MITEHQILQARILIVDDQLINTKILQSLLHKAGYHNISTINDSRKAIASYLDIIPDLLILDLCMPHVDGFEIMKQLKNSHEETYLPILVISNEESQEVRYKALESGAKDFLNKPYPFF